MIEINISVFFCYCCLVVGISCFVLGKSPGSLQSSGARKLKAKLKTFYSSNQHHFLQTSHPQTMPGSEGKGAQACR